MKKELSQLKKEGFVPIQIDCTGLLLNLIPDLSIDQNDSETDEYRNYFKLGVWSLKKSIPIYNEMEIELEGNFRVLGSKCLNCELTYWNISDNEDIQYQFNEKTFLSTIKEIIEL